MSERQLSELLHDLTPDPPLSVDPNVITRRARRRRRTINGISVLTAGFIVATAATVPLLTLGRHGGASPATPSGDRLYTVDAPLLSVRGGSFTACQIILDSLPPAGCSGVPITGIEAATLPTLVRYANGSMGTSPLHLVGHWNGKALVITKAPTPSDHTTAIPEEACTPSTATGRALQARIKADTASLSEHGVGLISYVACGDTASISVAVADPATVEYLRGQYGNVTVVGWLRAAAG